MPLKTPLYDAHLALGAKMAPFASYDMPINYTTGVIQEHEWVRAEAGLFDVSHMGQAIVKGPSVIRFLERITPSRYSAMAIGRAKYTVLTNEQGGIIDDLIITKLADDEFFLVFNAGRREVDIAWFKQNLPSDIEFSELADNALIALQGPKSESVLASLLNNAEELATMPYMSLLLGEWQSERIMISRLGYTGEDGFELSIAADKVIELWNALLQNPQVKAIGLAARDSLRLEMGYPLYGHDLDENTTPVEAALDWTIARDHNSHIGAEIIMQHRTNGAPRKRMGIKLLAVGVAREGAEIFIGTQKIGMLTSGGFSPSLKASIGQGYVQSEFANIGQTVEVEVRDRRIPAVLSTLAHLPAKTKTMKKEL